MKKVSPIKISLIITDIFLFILIVFSIALPWMVTWYAEVMKRSASLATTVLITCYPCVPFAAATLIFLHKLLKNASDNGLFNNNSIAILKKITLCTLSIAVITLVAGNFYMPFFLVAATFAFVSLLSFSFRGLILKEISENKE